MLRLRASRTTVSLEGPQQRLETTSAVVALTPEAGRVGIVAVGENDAELTERLSKRIEAGVGLTIAAKILETAQRKMDPADNVEPLRLIRPGEDAWWDKKWQDPYALKKGDDSRARDPKQVLVLWPLSKQSWSPHLIRGVLMYVLWTSAWTRGRTWPAFRRPDVELVAEAEIDGLHYAELVDQLRAVWGARRVHLPAGREVQPPPATPTQTAHRIARVLWWIALVAAIALARPGEATEPTGWALIAAAVAAIALMASRVLKARMEAERPRLQAQQQTNPPAQQSSA